jgi:nucleotide-binding universal stress UspA family protein
MNETQPKPAPVQVVIAYDFSPSAEEALLRGIELACRAPQHVLHVLVAIDTRHGFAIAPTEHVDYAYAERLQKIVTSRLVEGFAGRETASEVQFFVHARIGKAAEQILHLAREIGADMIIVGSHGKTGVERIVLGSVSERVVREAHCAVIVARTKAYSDVALARVVPYEHERHTYHPPHRYVYVDRQVIKRPDDWPLA